MTSVIEEPEKKQMRFFPSQIKVLGSKSKVTLMVSGRGVGKSYVNAFWCLYKLFNDPKACGLLLAPTHQQSQEIISYLSQHCERLGIPYEVNRKPKWCKSTYADHSGLFSVCLDHTQHSWIRVASAEKYDNLRGFTVSWLSLDEAAMMRPEVYDTVTPCLRGRAHFYKYQILLTTTPRGITNSWIYSRFIDNKPADVSIINCPSSENFYDWPIERIEDVRKEMSDTMFRQEIMGEFLDRNMNSVFYAFHDDLIEDKQKPLGRLCVSSDQNVSPLCTGIFYVNGKKVYMSDEIVQEEANVRRLAAQIHHRIGKPQMIYLYGDRSGHNRKDTGDASFYKQLKEALSDLKYRLVDETNKTNPKVFDSAELVNRKMEQGDFSISPTCKVAIEHLKRAVWKNDKYEIDKKLFDPHMGDLIRYICAKKAPVKSFGINLPRL